MNQQIQHSTSPTPPRSGRPQSLRRYLRTLLGGMSLVTLLVVGSSVFFFISQSEQRAWQGRQQEAARYAGKTIATFIQHNQDSLTLIGLPGRETLEAEPLMMRDFLEQNPAFLEIIRLDERGRVVASAYQGGPVMTNLFTIPQSNWFLRARAGEPYLSGIQISAGNEPYLIMAIPAPDGGVAAARLGMNVLWDVVADIQFGESGRAYVVDQKGEIIAHTEPDVALARTSLEGRPEMVALSQSPNQEWNGSYQNFEGTRVVGVTAPLPGTDWVVITELPQAEALATSRTALLLLGGGMGLFGVLMLWVTARFLGQLIVRPMGKLRAGAERIGRGDLSHRIGIVRRDEVGQLSTAFNRMASELEDLYQQITARTRDLERRTRYLEATAVVARDAASVLDQQQLLSRVARLISERFGFYHAGIFLINSTGEWAVLQAASSEGGRRMLARGYRLRVGQEGIVGYVTGRGEPRVALDVGADAVFFDNPDLPETRSEMALPLRIRGEIIGTLDVQSVEPEAFSDEDAVVLQTLADQVAVAINNAQLFQQVQESLEAERRAYGELSREAWAELLRARPDLGYCSDERSVTSAGELWRPEMERALQEGQTVQGGIPKQRHPENVEQAKRDGADTKVRHPLAVPIKVLGNAIGVLDTYKPGDAGEWTAEEVALMEALADQLGAALESARLYQETQHRAARERLTREITDKMRSATSVDGIVRTAVDGLFEALGASRTFVRLGTASPAREDEEIDRKSQIAYHKSQVNEVTKR